MSSQSLYRKWRSQSFDDIIGQDHVVRTLRNAIRHDRVAHAYLFTGPRGTGKTSSARILAKAVNCLDPQEGGPCTRCELCISIATGRSPDVIEIDGASNNSIDDVRILRERAAFAPAEARFKVYIIDEVHRLSGQAFDGLLKTLEEPPQHVLFVFASTEPHKLPATILSRCQRFDFHKIDRRDTVARLKQVAEKEGLEVDPEALVLIAQQSAGSLRDALGILDQVHAFAGDHIQASEVRQSVGLGRPTTVADLTDHMLDRDTGKALKLVDEAVADGVDPRSLSRQLVEYWRALLLTVSGAGAEIDVDPALEEAAAHHAKRLDARKVVTVLRTLTEQVIEPRLSVSPQLPLELGLVESIIRLQQASNHNPVEPPTTGPESMREAAAPDDGKATQRSVKKEASGEAARPDLERSLSYDGSDPTHRSIQEASGQTAEQPTYDAAVQMEENVAAESRIDTPTVGNLPEAWPMVLESVRKRSPKLQALLRDAKLMEWNDGEVTLGFVYTFHREQVDQPDIRRIVEEVLGEATGSRRRVRCIATTRDTQSEPGPGSNDDMDDFVQEAERMLRGVHARQIRSSRSAP